jgi:hypothetical protein
MFFFKVEEAQPLYLTPEIRPKPEVRRIFRFSHLCPATPVTNHNSGGQGTKSPFRPLKTENIPVSL